MKQIKRIIVSLISVAIISSMMTGMAFAEEFESEEQATVENSIANDTLEEGFVEVEQDVVIDPEVAGDNDELLEAYIEVQLSTRNDPMFSVDGVGKYLTGVEYVTYNVLKEKAALIASGDIPDAQFTFEGVDLGLKDSYTAADLDVETLGNHYTGKVTEEAQKKIAKLFPNLNLVVTALLFDCPYDLYWYDKATEGAGGMTMKYGYSYSNDGTIISINRLTCTISFTVAEDYADVNGHYYTDTNDNSHPITVDKSKTTAVNTALKNIIDIVEKNAYLNDYSKVKAYKDTIDALVDYNHTAVQNNNTPYGNPWQLIWVFDNDPDTKVVCEGYSKAFQFLCDLSEFDSSNVKSRLVSGTMRGATGAGGHMWNILTMDDGNNYLVDVTNCDYGTVGYSDYLFLVGDANGSVDSGYSVNISSRTIYYDYDENTRNAYDTSELALAAVSYQKPVDNKKVRIASAQVGLEDQIFVKFNLILNDGAAEDYTVQYTLKDELHQIPLSNLVRDNEGRYTVIVPVVAKEMTEPINIWVENYVGDIASNEITYSVETYCLNKIRNDRSEKKLKDLCAAILNYGAYAQLKFNYNTGVLANRSLGKYNYSTAVPTVTFSSPDPVTAGTTNGIAIKSATLGLEEATVIRFRFTLDEGEDISNFSFKCGGKELDWEDAGIVNGVANYLVYIRGIAAKDLDEEYFVKVRKNGAGSLDITYSVLMYLFNKSKAEDEALQNLCNVMYFYYIKAAEYFEIN